MILNKKEGCIQMEKIIYVYLLDTMADWELAYVLSAINMKEMQRKTKTKYTVKTVGQTTEPIRTMGGLTVTPDCSISEIDTEKIAALLLPGASTWDSPQHKSLLKEVPIYLEKGILVAAICGATLALANLSILDTRKHTSSALEFLIGFSPTYQGQDYYQDALSTIDNNLITASPAGALLFAKQILNALAIFPSPMIEAWYNYYLTGEARYYLELVALSNE